METEIFSEILRDSGYSSNASLLVFYTTSKTLEGFEITHMIKKIG